MNDSEDPAIERLRIKLEDMERTFVRLNARPRRCCCHTKGCPDIERPTT